MDKRKKVQDEVERMEELFDKAIESVQFALNLTKEEKQRITNTFSKSAFLNFVMAVKTIPEERKFYERFEKPLLEQYSRGEITFDELYDEYKRGYDKFITTQCEFKKQETIEEEIKEEGSKKGEQTE